MATVILDRRSTELTDIGGLSLRQRLYVVAATDPDTNLATASIEVLHAMIRELWEEVTALHQLLSAGPLVACLSSQRCVE